LIGVPRTSKPSFSNARMITDTVCADSPVVRAMFAFGKPSWRRTSESTKRSLWARTPD
jgi:hypothetical protein